MGGKNRVFYEIRYFLVIKLYFEVSFEIWRFCFFLGFFFRVVWVFICIVSSVLEEKI